MIYSNEFDKEMSKIREKKIKEYNTAISNPLIKYLEKNKDIDPDIFTQYFRERINIKEKHEYKKLNIKLNQDAILKINKVNDEYQSYEELFNYIWSIYEVNNYQKNQIESVFDDYINELKDYSNYKFEKGKFTSIDFSHPDYQIIEQLGEGGQGKVLKVFNKRSSELKALKLYKKSAKDSYEKELNILSFLDRTQEYYLINNYEIIETENYYGIAMEFGIGTLSDFKNLLQSTKKELPELELLCILYTLYFIELQLNEFGIYHRDIKPDNIIINGNYLVQLVDYGIAVKIDNKQIGQRDIVTTTWAGTENYVPKENSELRHFTKDDLFFSDIYAIMMVILELHNTSFKANKFYEDQLKKCEGTTIATMLKTMMECQNKNFLKILEHQIRLNNHPLIEKKNEIDQICSDILYDYFSKQDRELRSFITKSTNLKFSEEILSYMRKNYQDNDLILYLEKYLANHPTHIKSKETKLSKIADYNFILSDVFYSNKLFSEGIYYYHSLFDLSKMQSKTKSLTCLFYLSHIALIKKFTLAFFDMCKELLSYIPFDIKDSYFYCSILGFFFYLNKEYNKAIYTYKLGLFSTNDSKFKIIALNNLGCCKLQLGYKESINTLVESLRYLNEYYKKNLDQNRRTCSISVNDTTEIYSRIDVGYDVDDILIIAFNMHFILKDKIKINIVFLNLTIARSLKFLKLFRSTKKFIPNLLFDNQQLIYYQKINEFILCFLSACFLIKIVAINKLEAANKELYTTINDVIECIYSSLTKENIVSPFNTKITEIEKLLKIISMKIPLKKETSNIKIEFASNKEMAPIIFYERISCKFDQLADECFETRTVFYCGNNEDPQVLAFLKSNSNYLIKQFDN